MKRRSTDEQEATDKARLGGGVPQTGGGVFKSAAVAVLQLERKLMTTGDITKVALERGLILSQGKTPEATMASALYTDVKRKADKSAFTRPQEGLFGLRAWIEEKFYPDGWSGSAGAGGLAPFKKRNTATKSRKSAGRAAKGRAQASWQGASEERDEEGSGVADDHEYEDAEVPGGAEQQGATSEELEDPAFKSPVPSGRTRGAGSAIRAASSREASGGRNLNAYTSPQQLEQQQQQQQQQTNDDGMVDLGNIGKTDLESPLHVLGDAALNTFGRPGPARLQTGKRPRKRPSGLGIQVPEGSANSRIQDGTITPKSPYVDSLAALHEIATSPHPYAAANAGNLDPSDRRCRPRYSMEPDKGYAAQGQPSAPYLVHVPILHPQSNMLQLQTLQSSQAWRPGGVNTMKGLISIMPLQSHPDEQLQGSGHANDRAAEAACMLNVAERLEARLGHNNAQVGKAWLAAARMHHSLWEAGGDVVMMQRASQALKHVQEVCQDVARAVGATFQCDLHFTALQQKLGQQAVAEAGKDGSKEASGHPSHERQANGPIMMPPPPPPALQHVPAK